MDLSNRESAAHWYRVAQEVQDKDLRKEAIATYKKYRNMSLQEERVRLRRSKPGYGIRSMFISIIIVSVVVAALVLALSLFFPIGKILTALLAVVAISLVSWAIVLRVHGHVSEEGMLSMIQSAVKALSSSWTAGQSGTSKAQPKIEANPERPKLPPAAPSISFDGTEDKQDD